MAWTLKAGICYEGAVLSADARRPLIGDDDAPPRKNVERLVFCSGKVYYDLEQMRREREIVGVAIIRVEELYPFPVDDYARTLETYPNATDIVWCQEEPQNQGAWYQIRHRLQEPLSGKQQLYYAGRPGAAAPASGIFKLHLQQQQALVEAALDIDVRASRSKKPPR